jgi:hypothetical protein
MCAAFFDSGAGPVLYIGGDLDGGGGIPSPALVAYAPCPPCAANCDNSTTPPRLNIADFICFQSQFAAGDPRANCDHSTTPPILNIADFVCFQQAFAAGCP